MASPAAGAVAVVQFIKSGEWNVGEEQHRPSSSASTGSLGDGFTWDSDDLEHDKAVAREAWARRSGDDRAPASTELVILDELTYLCTWGWIDTAEVVARREQRPAHVNVIITGRDAPAELVEVADTVTEMRKVKHAFDAGVGAKRGLDH